MAWCADDRGVEASPFASRNGRAISADHSLNAYFQSLIKRFNLMNADLVEPSSPHEKIDHVDYCADSAAYETTDEPQTDYDDSSDVATDESTTDADTDMPADWYAKSKFGDA
jgi:hypothetical protein